MEIAENKPNKKAVSNPPVPESRTKTESKLRRSPPPKAARRPLLCAFSGRNLFTEDTIMMYSF
jgi:hypothetical protein